MRGEDDAIFRQTGVIENFGRVPMCEEIVGLEIFVQLHKVQIAPRLFAGSAGAGLAVAYDAAAIGDEMGIGKRTNGEDHAGRVAPGIGNEARFCDLLLIKLGKAVDGFTKIAFVRSRKLVPGFECVRGLEAERAAEIDDAQPGLNELRRDFGGNLMWRRQERRAGAALLDGVHRKLAQRSFAHTAKLRKHLREALRASSVAHIEDRIYDIRMAQKNARQLKSGITGDTYHGDLV